MSGYIENPCVVNELRQKIDYPEGVLQHAQGRAGAHPGLTAIDNYLELPFWIELRSQDLFIQTVRCAHGNWLLTEFKQQHREPALLVGPSCLVPKTYFAGE